MKVLRRISAPGRWCVHSYYTLVPYAPDGSGRLLLAGVDLKTRLGKVYVIGADGKVKDEFGENPVESNFFHTGFWQTWSPDCRYVYFQSGSLTEPKVTRRELATGREITLRGDAEGAPPHGEPIASGLLGMLYGAGYGYGVYNPAIAPVPFEDRTRHGVFEYTFDPPRETLRLSVQQFLDAHPDREKLLAEDRRLAEVHGTPTGLTLMCYCIRWNRDGSRMMIHFGNHCVARKEPKVLYLFTCKRDFSDLHLALNLENGGVHWSWHPDCEHLVGYSKLPGGDQWVFSTVRYDGTGWRQACDAKGGGHPSVSPADPNLMVTDTGAGTIDFWDLEANRIVDSEFFPNTQASPIPENQARGCLRNETRVCHHPVFSRDGSRVLFNAFNGDLSELVEVEVPRRK
ncbi:MAG: hypothetical protein E7055_09365 [Lentisphaerae bacterium]|nr:hypothetical protein [Lentisphaerota bacterium]